MVHSLPLDVQRCDEFVINALASVHLDIVKAIREHADQNGG
jgi:hypothetical protein